MVDFDSEALAAAAGGDPWTLRGRFTAMQANTAMAPQFRQEAAAGYRQEAVETVSAAGNPLRQSVEDYEAALAAHLKTLSDLGYVPPAELDEGPPPAERGQAATD